MQQSKGLMNDQKHSRPGPDLEHLCDALDAYAAEDAGMTVAQWRDLDGAERIRLEEEIEDGTFAAGQGITLQKFRERKRAAFEMGHLRPEYGCPQWLRTIYAR